ncbi:hypothetical protein Hypma_013702 [Hypsizygus marmoreus]|uniref:F-box domain-containing protein n=1 Tax=Hypsizygus marmoreus TaxID=39966 RepID=A0A369JBK7_HYPMA|nr:hypothetical protein Hypma_013702 [Hypsizygus marmoreus]
MPFLETIRNVLVQARVNARELLPPPIHRIPVELLEEIFFNYLNIHRKKSYDWLSGLYVSSECTTNPLVFGHICRHWRIVALSMPRLWASLAICEPKPYMVPMARTWLERAANCPLSLYMAVNINPTITESVTANTLLSLFISHFRQWKQIDFNLTRHQQKSRDKVWRSISCSPDLRRVSWDSWYMHHKVPNHIRWALLTHVKMAPGPDSLTPDAFLEILRSCQLLVDLDLDVRIPDDPTEYLNRLILPALTSIDITQYSTSSRPGIVYLQDLFSRSSCRLRRVLLADSGIEEHQIVHFLCSPHVQAVDDLYIRSKAITNTTVSFLTSDSTNAQRVLPDLKKLSLYSCDVTASALSEMIATRVPILETFNTD